MRRLASTCIVLLAGCATSTSQAAEQRVLIVHEARAFVHDSIPAATSSFRRLGARSPHYDVVELEGGAEQLTRRRLRHADAVVFANTSGELPLPDRAALRTFVANGGAFVGTHSASDTLHSWPAFERLLGAEFARHGAVQEGRLVVHSPRHQITRGLPRSVSLTDEFYEFADALPSHTRVLVSLDPRSVPDEAAANVPLVWARRYGAGRVFYDALGHLPATWRERWHRRIIARGLDWALGQGPG